MLQTFPCNIESWQLVLTIWTYLTNRNLNHHLSAHRQVILNFGLFLSGFDIWHTSAKQTCWNSSTWRWTCIFCTNSDSIKHTFLDYIVTSKFFTEALESFNKANSSKASSLPPGKACKLINCRSIVMKILTSCCLGGVWYSLKTSYAKHSGQ